VTSPAETASKFDYKTHFRFGKNWRRYAATITEEKIELARQNLCRLLGRDRLDGLTFLDIGCGSGLHSLAALRSGAAFVQAVDIDPDSVSTASALLASRYRQQNYRVDVGNIFLLSEQIHERFDVVYSWGVLHHTGDLWEAIRRATAFVKDDGIFAIAIYLKTPRDAYWKEVKRRYTQGSSLTKGYMLSGYITNYMVKKIKKGRNPFKEIAAYGRSNRGMNWLTDAIDWLGGYPYEAASPDEIEGFTSSLGFRLEQAFGAEVEPSGRSGSGNAEYRFRRTTAPG
jgi:2-polyprenyl-3-methyl-5-hydroxy-6-metoxy-1,4-benzoquinol methylase